MEWTLAGNERARKLQRAAEDDDEGQMARFCRCAGKMRERVTRRGHGCYRNEMRGQLQRRFKQRLTATEEQTHNRMPHVIMGWDLLCKRTACILWTLQTIVIMKKKNHPPIPADVPVTALVYDIVNAVYTKMYFLWKL